MPGIKLQRYLRVFDQNVQNALAFSRQAKNFRMLRPDGKPRHIGVRRVEALAGLTLLMIYLLWEDFLESVFVRYMCGAKSASGFAPLLCLAPQPTITAAMTQLLSSQGANYLDWNSNAALRRACRYFDRGEPFLTALGAARQTLEDTRIVRNRFAHRSEFAKQQFRTVVLRSLGYVPRGMGPGRFLLTTNPSSLAGGQTFIEFYANTLLGASQSIVP